MIKDGLLMKRTFTTYSEVSNPLTETTHLIQTNSLDFSDQIKSNEDLKLFHAISLITNARIKLGEQKKNKGSKRTADGHEKLYINREIKNILQPIAAEFMESLGYDFYVLLFHLVGVEASTIRTYKTSLGNFNKFILHYQNIVLMPERFQSDDHILTFYQIIESIMTVNPKNLQILIDRYIIWGASKKAKQTVLNMSSGVIFFGEFILDQPFPRPTKKLVARAKKLAKNGTGGAIPFPNEDLPLALIEWLLTQTSTKDQWSGVFYALMFYGTLRPTITYTLSPKNLKFINKFGTESKHPRKKTTKVILEVFRYKNQENHEKPKRIPFDWITTQTGPSPTNIIQIFRHLFKKHKTSPKFSSSAKLLQSQLQRFKKEEKLNFRPQKYTPESFRETMMGIASKTLHPHQLMYVTHHRSDRSIKHTYLAKQKEHTFEKYNQVINTLFEC